MISRIWTGCLLAGILANAQPPSAVVDPAERYKQLGYGQQSQSPQFQRYSQQPRPCPPNTTCTYVYRIPPDGMNKLLAGNPQCTKTNPVFVRCTQPVKGSFGQYLMPNPAPESAPINYTVPSAPPPLGVPPAQQAEADQLVNRAFGLMDANQNRQAFPLLLKAGNMGDKRAQATLGICFQDGKGVKANARAAAYWYSAAAAQGHRAAQYALGGMYEFGVGGLPKDMKKATELYIKSANQGFDLAQYALGIQYELGQEVPRSRAKAIQLLRQANVEYSPWMAQVLADPKTPAKFADETAFGNYLASLRNAAFAASWAKAQAATASGIGVGDDPIARMIRSNERNYFKCGASPGGYCP